MEGFYSQGDRPGWNTKQKASWQNQFTVFSTQYSHKTVALRCHSVCALFYTCNYKDETRRQKPSEKESDIRSLFMIILGFWLWELNHSFVPASENSKWSVPPQAYLNKKTRPGGFPCQLCLCHLYKEPVSYVCGLLFWPRQLLS